MYLAKNLHVSSRTKHIDIRTHYVREHLKEHGNIRAIRSEDSLSCVLTKNVAVNIFEKLGKSLLNGFEGHDNKFQFSKCQRENI